ncbi:hypothetical protein DUGA2_48440 [Duganella sp. HH101]|nr:hypothetical protein DUGA2_48440 [Duganella sp. HH101]
MKELRFKANHGAEVWRAAFAFDPLREAIVLIAADKQGIDEKKFYKDLLKKANERFDKHLENLRTTVAAGPSKVQKKSTKGKK